MKGVGMAPASFMQASVFDAARTATNGRGFMTDIAGEGFHRGPQVGERDFGTNGAAVGNSSLVLVIERTRKRQGDAGGTRIARLSSYARSVPLRKVARR